MQVTVSFLWILVWVCFKGFLCNQIEVLIWKWSKHHLVAKQYATHLNYRGHTLNSQELQIPELYVAQANRSNKLYRPVWVKYNAWNLSYDTHRISANWECEQNSSAASLTPPPPNIWPMFAWHWGKYQFYHIYRKLLYVSSCTSHQKCIPVHRCQHTGSSVRQHVSDKITRCCGLHLPSHTGRSMVTLCLVKTWFSVCLILW